MKWHGYRDPTWEPLEAMSETAALERFEGRYGDAKENDGPLEEYTGKRKKQGEVSFISYIKLKTRTPSVLTAGTQRQERGHRPQNSGGRDGILHVRQQLSNDRPKTIG